MCVRVGVCSKPTCVCVYETDEEEVMHMSLHSQICEYVVMRMLGMCVYVCVAM